MRRERERWNSVSDVEISVRTLRDGLADPARWKLENAFMRGYGTSDPVESRTLFRDSGLPRIELIWISEWEIHLSFEKTSGWSIEEEFYPRTDAPAVISIVKALAESQYHLVDGTVVVSSRREQYRFAVEDA